MFKQSNNCTAQTTVRSYRKGVCQATGHIQLSQHPILGIRTVMCLVYWSIRYLLFIRLVMRGHLSTLTESGGRTLCHEITCHTQPRCMQVTHRVQLCFVHLSCHELITMSRSRLSLAEPREDTPARTRPQCASHRAWLLHQKLIYPVCQPAPFTHCAIKPFIWKSTTYSAKWSKGCNMSSERGGLDACKR